MSALLKEIFYKRVRKLIGENLKYVLKMYLKISVYFNILFLIKIQYTKVNIFTTKLLITEYRKNFFLVS